MSTASTAGRVVRPSLATAFDSRRNSLNFLRLVLALVVLISHAYFLGGFGDENIAHVSTPGTLAVYGFFAMSGFLVTASAARSGTADYLRKRILRIYPGFWAALAVTAAVIAPLAVRFQERPSRAVAAGWLTGPDSAPGYVLRNATLAITQRGIAGTPADVRVAGIWNGSLWTLAFEFGCYLLVLALARAGALQRPRLMAALAGAAWGALLIATSVPALHATITVFRHPVLTPALVLVPIFLAGACLWVWRERLPDSGGLAGACLAGYVLAQFLPVGAAVPAYTLTTGSLAAPLLAYPLLWAGMHLPFTRVGRRNDYSYGVYLYAFPVEQGLLLVGAGGLGLCGYTMLVLAVTAACAAFSWHVVEKPALRLARRGPW